MSIGVGILSIGLHRLVQKATLEISEEKKILANNMELRFLSYTSQLSENQPRENIINDNNFVKELKFEVYLKVLSFRCLKKIA